MELLFNTHVTWNRSLTQVEKDAINTKIAELVAAGVTDGVAHDGPPDSEVPVLRNWTTEEADTNWILFVNTFVPPPVSAV